MKNIENWKFSNRFFPIGFIIINAFNFIVLYLASLIFEIDSLSIYFYIVPLLIEIAVLIYITENKMKNENL